MHRWGLYGNGEGTNGAKRGGKEAKDEGPGRTKTKFIQPSFCPTRRKEKKIVINHKSTHISLRFLYSEVATHKRKHSCPDTIKQKKKKITRNAPSFSLRPRTASKHNCDTPPPPSFPLTVLALENRVTKTNSLSIDAYQRQETLADDAPVTNSVVKRPVPSKVSSPRRSISILGDAFCHPQPYT